MTEHITWHPSVLGKKDRQHLNGHQSFVLWFTGLSGSGKSTLANEVDRQLYSLGVRSYVLDGDNIRHGLNRGLGFSKEDRVENIRRIGEVSKLFVDSGQVVLAAFISPFREDRDGVRKLFDGGEFIEVFTSSPLEVCEKRDVKGLYQKARRGEIREFTGIDSPYEIPLEPELVVDTSSATVAESARQVIGFLKERGLI
ncbi:adenylyl-sulfate kinase [Bacillus sp. B-jedd]|uniref:adenylyl-sulfate kinase n=1 Tax=Bacillus sp. B-jedd TaxID=1476857 RepID=UPI0005155510|nr:adenylyl-sulfate kinase [Bacillus sp. B-jedd]CEG28913.1 adenylylsulfate kinase [Bacillus sp. B-jedd]